MFKFSCLLIILTSVIISNCLRLRQIDIDDIFEITRSNLNELGLISNLNDRSESVFERSLINNLRDRKLNITNLSENKAGLSLLNGAQGRTVSGEKSNIQTSKNKTKVSSEHRSGTEINANGGSGESASIHNSGNRIETSDYKIETTESSSSIIKVGPGGNAQSSATSSSNVEVKNNKPQGSRFEKPEENLLKNQSESERSASMDIENDDESQQNY
jgi:hypothetical protein